MIGKRGRIACKLDQHVIHLLLPAQAGQSGHILCSVNTASSFDDRFDAEVWLTDMSTRLERQVRDPDERLELLTRIHQEATFAGLAPELVLAVIEV